MVALLDVALKIKVDQFVKDGEQCISVDNLIVVEAANKFHKTYASLGIFEIVLLDSSNDLLKDVIQYANDEVAVHWF